MSRLIGTLILQTQLFCTFQTLYKQRKNSIQLVLDEKKDENVIDLLVLENIQQLVDYLHRFGILLYSTVYEKKIDFNELMKLMTDTQLTINSCIHPDKASRDQAMTNHKEIFDQINILLSKVSDVSILDLDLTPKQVNWMFQSSQSIFDQIQGSTLLEKVNHVLGLYDDHRIFDNNNLKKSKTCDWLVASQTRNDNLKKDIFRFQRITEDISSIDGISIINAILSLIYQSVSDQDTINEAYQKYLCLHSHVEDSSYYECYARYAKVKELKLNYVTLFAYRAMYLTSLWVADEYYRISELLPDLKNIQNYMDLLKLYDIRQLRKKKYCVDYTFGRPLFKKPDLSFVVSWRK
jgi:hypothetical protein